MECASTTPEGLYIVSGLQEVSQNTLEMALYKFQLLLLVVVAVFVIVGGGGGGTAPPIGFKVLYALFSKDKVANNYHFIL